MSLQLRNDEMLEVLLRIDPEAFSRMVERVEELGRELGHMIVARVPNVKLGRTEHWDSETMTSIIPIDLSQPIPAALEGLDDGGWE